MRHGPNVDLVDLSTRAATEQAGGQPDPICPDEADRIMRAHAWRVAPADRVAFVVDGAAYYAALSEAFARAERSIFILAWDIDSRVEFPHPFRSGTVPLVQLLNELAARRKELRIFILSWDYASIYLFERQLLPAYHLGLRTHERVRFHLDAQHPIGAAHHQKVVVIDDTLAFSGGLDITDRRWDTSAHRARDPRRRDASGERYAPFHDVQIAVEGPAARALGELARRRWLRATGERTARTRSRSPGAPSLWPKSLTADLSNAEVTITRTEPAFRGRPRVREVEEQIVAAIRAAQRIIFAENQYLSSAVVAEALARRLSEPHGPEVVLICPRCCSGWLEESTIGRLRERFLATLKAADHHQRLRVYSPRVTEDEWVYVHSKVLVIDDRIARVGSANFSSRSLGVDTECDVAVAAPAERHDLRRGIAGLRDRLLGEHLDVPADRVAAERSARGSLLAAIEALRAGERTLVPTPPPPVRPELAPPVAEVADPDRPLDGEALASALLPEEHMHRRRAPLVAGALALAGLLTMTAIWRLSPLAEWLGPNEVLAWLLAARQSPAAPLVVVTAYAVLATLMVPINALVLPTLLAFGPVVGGLCAIAGALLSAGAGYGLGRAFGRRLVKPWVDDRLGALARSLARRGVLAVVTARVIPVAPFGLVNVLAGASGVRARAFFLGTAIGMIPGIVVLAVVGQGLLAAFRAEHPRDVLGTLALGFALLTAIFLLGRALRRRSRQASKLTHRRGAPEDATT